MWQNLINAILGMLFVLIAFLAATMGALPVWLGWTLGIGGLAVAAFAVWGILDEMENYPPRLNHQLEGDV